jgi:hypothetical protein
LSLVTG